MKSYTVRTGHHRFRPVHFFDLCRKRVDYFVIFRHDCQYNNGQDDWNKLMGVSSWRIHHTSYRFGWRYRDGKIELNAYWYEDGQRFYTDTLTYAQFDLPVRLMIRQEGNKIVWRIDRKKVHEIIGRMPWLTFQTGIYFGGDQPAPHNMTIEIA